MSTRRYRRTQEPVGEQAETKARSTSKSAVSRTFVERTREALGELMGRQLGDLRLAVMMLDGLELKGRMMIVALGITTEGVKIPLGLWEGSTENATVATALLSDLVERGLDPEQGMLFVLGGSKALRKAVRSVFGDVPVQRCRWHKERNVLGHLPERDRPPIEARMRRAWRETDYPRALEQLTRLADELEHTHPGAGSLREGMEETLTVIVPDTSRYPCFSQFTADVPGRDGDASRLWSLDDVHRNHLLGSLNPRQVTPLEPMPSAARAPCPRGVAASRNDPGR